MTTSTTSILIDDINHIGAVIDAAIGTTAVGNVIMTPLDAQGVTCIIAVTKFA